MNIKIYNTCFFFLIYVPFFNKKNNIFSNLIIVFYRKNLKTLFMEMASITNTRIESKLHEEYSFFS